MVVLPAPVGPTSATTWPGWACRLTCFSTGTPSSYPKLTSSKTTSPLTCVSGSASGASTCSGTSSIVSKTRSAPATADWSELYRLAISFSGRPNWRA